MIPIPRQMPNYGPRAMELAFFGTTWELARVSGEDPLPLKARGVRTDLDGEQRARRR
jgi:hypothetical protein